MSPDKDIMREFQTESQMILGELMGIVESLDGAETFDANLFAEFAQKIDRIMGGAETMAMLDPGHHGLKAMADLARLCKQIGYKVAENNRANIAPMVASFWMDVVEILQALLRNLDDVEECKKISDGFTGALKGRLEWLAGQLK